MARLLILVATLALMGYIFMKWGTGRNLPADSAPTESAQSNDSPNSVAPAAAPAAALRNAKKVTDEVNEKNRKLNEQLKSLE